MIERAVHLPPRADGSPRSLRALATALALWPANSDRISLSCCARASAWCSTVLAALGMFFSTAISVRWEIVLSAHFAHVCRMGLEGVVSKRADAPYHSGPSKMWLKSKNPASEAVRREREEEWR